MEKHFTSTVFILFDMKILLHIHPKQNKWLPPGGHVEKNETPSDAAKREVMEETGLEIEFINQENIWIDESNAKSIQRPYLCLLEEIQHPFPHQHIDFIYLAKPKKKHHIEKPYDAFKWLSLNEVTQIPDNNIYPDTKKIIQKIIEENFILV